MALRAAISLSSSFSKEASPSTIAGASGCCTGALGGSATEADRELLEEEEEGKAGGGAAFCFIGRTISLDCC